MKQDLAIIKLILDEYKDIIKNLRQEAIKSDVSPPLAIYVELMDSFHESSKNGDVTEAWMINEKSIKKTDIKEEQKYEIKGMYYQIGSGWFSFDEKNTKVSINWLIGPRYGRGNIQRIGKDNNGNYLIDKGKLTWLS